MNGTQEKIDIMSLLPDELEAFFATLGEPRYRAKQVYSRLCRGDSLDDMTSLSKPLREKLCAMCEQRLPAVAKKQMSSDGTVKYLFRLIDGEAVESVFMRYHHGNTLCISTEVGCAMGCAFCASTIGGKVRNLTPSEMLGQIVAAEKDVGERVSNVVMMGIGEPLDNYDNVLKFLRLVNHPDGLNIGYRHISLSTCGLVPKILDLARENLPITLSVSLHASDDTRRSAIMPINKKYPIAVLLDACNKYFAATGRRISFEYTLIAGENDSERDAAALASLMKRYFSSAGEPVHVNLIRLNKVAERDRKAPEREAAERFAAALIRAGINATIRRSLGGDIDAACGQLRHNSAAESE